jgi:hypothetical protein
LNRDFIKKGGRLKTIIETAFLFDFTFRQTDFDDLRSFLSKNEKSWDYSLVFIG